MFKRSCIIEDNVQFGSGTVVGENSRVANSVIGKNCKIGSNVNIDGAYLWDNVVIEDGAEVKRSILANDAVILEDTTLLDGCIVSFGVSFRHMSFHKQNLYHDNLVICRLRLAPMSHCQSILELVHSLNPRMNFSMTMTIAKSMIEKMVRHLVNDIASRRALN